MKTPVEISQLSGSTPLANGDTLNRRYAISSVVDMVVQNVTELPSSGGAFKQTKYLKSLEELDSTEEKLSALGRLESIDQNVTEQLSNSHDAQRKGRWFLFPYIDLAVLIGQSQPKLLRSSLDCIGIPIRLPLIIFNTILCYFEAVLKGIACGLTDLFLWNCDNLSNKKTHFCYKLFVAFPLFFLTGLTYLVGQLTYLVANNVSYARYVIDATINLPFSLLALAFCRDKHPSIFRCLGTLIKNTLLLAPTAAIPLVIIFVPAVNALVLPFLTATLAMVVAQPLVVSAILCYALAGIFASSAVLSMASQFSSGIIRGIWDTIEHFCLRCCCGNPTDNADYESLNAAHPLDSTYNARPNNVAHASRDVEMQSRQQSPAHFSSPLRTSGNARRELLSPVQPQSAATAHAPVPRIAPPPSPSAQPSE